MGSEWPEHELSEFIAIKHGFAFKGEFFTAEKTDDYLVTPGNFAIGGGFKSIKFKYYNGPVPESYILKKDDLVVTMTDLSKEADTLGYSALIPDINGHRLLHNQRVGLVEFKNNGLNKIYLYFLLRSRDYRNHVISSVTGTTVKHTSPIKMVSHRFKKPPIEAQIAIGKNLLSIERKIELNRQTNQTLEQMAQALFKSWFVDFDPVIDNALAAGNAIPDELEDRAKRRQQQLARPDHKPLPDDIRQLFPSEFELTEELGWVPKGWEINNVEAIVRRLKAGKRYAKKEVSSYGGVPVYEQGQSILLGYHNDDANFLASLEDPVFIFGDHTCVTKLGVEPFSISANVIPLKGEKRNTYWTYFAVKDLQSFEEYRRHWMELAVKLVSTPSVQVADLFAGIIRPYFEKNNVVSKSSNTLERLRDTLLPKLISGELRLPLDALSDAEQQVSDATS